jgi:hypothetical protein
MKKIILIIFLFKSIISSSQEFTYKIVNYIEVERSETGEKYSEPKKVNTNFKFNIKSGKIEIPTLNETILSVVKEAKMPIPNRMTLKIISERSYKDSEKNTYLVFIGLAKDGHIYIIKIIDYEKPLDDGIQTRIIIEGDWLYTYNVVKL